MRRMPLLLGTSEDCLYWSCSRNDTYSVRSAYFHLMERVIANDELKVAGNWMCIWKLKAPQKIKHLLWRAARGILPTRERILSKGVECSTLCPMCANLPENEWHVFLGCPHVIKVWRAAGLWSIIDPFQQAARDCSDFIFQVFETLPTRQRSKVAALLWGIWRRRNLKVWEDELQPEALVVRLAFDYIDVWERVRSNQRGGAQPRFGSACQTWKKPELGVLKCNVDAAIFEDQQCFGVGLCLRNDRGEFIRALLKRFDGLPQSKEAEAVGLREVISWLSELGGHKVIIELDCQPVVDGVLGDHFPNTELGSILSFYKARLDIQRNC